jgi:hypothetical protein
MSGRIIESWTRRIKSLIVSHLTVEFDLKSISGLGRNILSCILFLGLRLLWLSKETLLVISWLKRPAREADHSPPSSAEVKE